MKAILPDFERETAVPLYLQLFGHMRDMILSGDISPGEKLPSLRNLSESLEISLTTVSQAYDQLLVEGYIHSIPKRGYFVSEMYYPGTASGSKEAAPDRQTPKANQAPPADHTATADLPSREEPQAQMFRAAEGPVINVPEMAYDLSSFDFVKWKKCLSRVLSEHPEALLFESEPQGEEALRQAITKYVYTSRGVRCTPDQVVIAAGTQQITAHMATILRMMGIENVALEEPGYAPVNSMFRDRGFAISRVPVGADGIAIERLPMNIRSAAYVAPQNQFPTGAVMPAGRRYRLLEWARENDSYIIEDDYDSELRYFGKPALALQGIDTAGRVVYLGSFSSTLFASIKISYMILPPKMAELFRSISSEYTQSCSKTEQLALALFMESGAYQTGIRKLRRSYSQKLRATLRALAPLTHLTPHDTNSGVGLLIDADPDALPKGKTSGDLVKEAAELGIPVSLFSPSENSGPIRLDLYYSRLPLDSIPGMIVKLYEKWYDSNE